MKYISAANGNLGDAASWDSASFDSGFSASAGSQITTPINSAVFTAPSLVAASTGVLTFFTAAVATDIITAKLQEFNGVDWIDVATGAIDFTAAECPPNSCWAYFRFTTPFTYTTLTAGYYRIQFSRSGAGGYFLTGDGSGNAFVIVSDDRHAVPGVGDDLYIAGHNGNNTEITITNVGTQSVGNGGGGTLLPVQRSDYGGVHICVGGHLVPDKTADSELTVKGHIIVAREGNFEYGTTASPVPEAYDAVLKLDQDGVADNYGIVIVDGSTFKMQGGSKTLWKSTFVSGVGTAASPMVLADSVDWTVGDRICVTPASNDVTNYNQTEYKFIITKNSATSYVLADTVGGAESALTHTHSVGAHVLNIQRNVRIESTDTTYDFWINDDNLTEGAVDIDWAEFVGLGASNSGTDQGRKGLNLIANLRYLSLDYTVFTKGSYNSLMLRQNKVSHTFTGLIFCDPVAASSNVAHVQVTQNANEKTFVDSFFLDHERIGFQAITVFNINLIRCVSAGNNADLDANCGGMYILTAGVDLTDCEIHCNGVQGIKAGAWVSDSSDTDFGVLGANGSYDIGFFDEYLHDVTLTNCLFSNTPDFIQSTYTSMLEGSEIRFHKFDQIENNHLWYRPTGVGRSTGAALADTTVRTTGSLALRIAAEDSETGFSWEYKVLAKSGSAMESYGFCKKDTTFGSDELLIELFLPGSTTPDDSVTMPNDTEWNVFSLGATYSGAVDAYGTIRVTAKTTGGGYVYVDDIYNGTNKIIGLDVWDGGKPSDIMFEQLGDSAAPWAVLVSSLTTSGTIGKLLAKALTIGKFLGLK